MINIASIMTTYQLQGGLKINSSFEDFDKIIGSKVYVEKNDMNYLFTVKDYKKINEKKYVIYFEEIENLEMAKNLIGYDIKVRRDILPKPTKDEYYLSDLITFKVYDKEKYIGDVFEILETAAHDILVVKGEREVMIPYVEDIFIKDIDFDNFRIDVELIEGM